MKTIKEVSRLHAKIFNYKNPSCLLISYLGLYETRSFITPLNIEPSSQNAKDINVWVGDYIKLTRKTKK